MTALRTKLRRDLRHHWPQVLSIAAVLAVGVATLVALRGTVRALERSRDALYAATGFADAQARLERAPIPVAERLATLPGVREVETRVVQAAQLPRPGDPLPPFGVLVSLPEPRPDARNRVVVLRGRLPEADDEALLLARFAARYGVGPGDTVEALARGARHRLRITGIGTSAEFVYPVPPGGGWGGDDDRYGVLWMPRRGLARLAGLEGAFNDALFRLAPGTDWPALRDAIDAVLAPYGGLGALPRADQASETVLSGEFGQLRSLTVLFPTIILAIAAFLVNVVVSRLILLQRPEIAALAALGYSRRAIAWHFAQFTASIAGLGLAGGFALGGWFGNALIGLYAEYFHLPRLGLAIDPDVALVSGTAALAACLVGATASLRDVLRLAPASAMRPPAPARYRRLLIDRVPALVPLSPTIRMLAREVERRPVNALLSTAGVAAAVGLLVAGRFNVDAIEQVLQLQFGLAAREDVSLVFVEAQPPAALAALAALPGVREVEGFRAVPVRLAHGGRHREAAIMAYAPGSTLRRLVDLRGAVHPMPSTGVTLSTVLADRLGVRPGDTVHAEVREGRRRTLALPVDGVVDDLVGMQAYADPVQLARWLGEAPVASGATLRLDLDSLAVLERRLGELGMVTGITTRRALVARFRDMMERVQGTMSLIQSLFASVIAAGIVYNSARVALAQRARDLASLRVLGFTRAEVTRMLLGEQALYLLLAMPIGLWLGRGLVTLILATIDPEQVRIPVEVSLRTDLFALAVVVAASTASALLLVRRIGRLDLIAVLKARE